MKEYKAFNLKKVVDLKHMEIGDHVTHGDLVIYKISDKDMPSDFDSLQAVKSDVFAEGEFSGHAHQLHDDVEFEVKPALELIKSGGKENPVFTLKQGPDGQMYLRLETTLLLRHQEHHAFRLYPGNYDIDKQLERNPYEDELRRVAD